MMFSRKEAFLQDFLMYIIISLKMFAGHIKVLCGPHVARGPDIAQAWTKQYFPTRVPSTHGWNDVVFGVKLKLDMLVI